MLKAGISLLQQVAVSAANSVIGVESSDDDESGHDTDIQDISQNSNQNTTRGLIIFTAYSKSNKEKILHINLHKGTITQFSEHRKKVNCVLQNSHNNFSINSMR